MNYTVIIGTKTYTVEITGRGSTLKVQVGSTHYVFSNARRVGKNLWKIEANGKEYILPFSRQGKNLVFRHEQKRTSAEVISTLMEQVQQELARSAVKKSFRIKSIMPGLVKQIHVRPGSKVEKGSPLLILEAMKMENEILSPHSGIVDKIHVKQQQSVESHALLISLKE